MLVSYPISTNGVMCERCGEATVGIRVEFTTPAEAGEFDVCFSCLRPLLDRLQAQGANHDGQDVVVEHVEERCEVCQHPLSVVVLVYTEELSASDMALRCMECGQVVRSWSRVEQREEQ